MALATRDLSFCLGGLVVRGAGAVATTTDQVAHIGVALADQAATTAAAAWPDPPEGWPVTVPAPSFLDGTPIRIENVRTGHRSASLETSSTVDNDDVVAYISLLFEAGFAPDLRAATHGWFVRDAVEWVALQNRDLSDFMAAGNTANPRSFIVQWTTNPVQLGYCRIVESGGQSCRE